MIERILPLAEKVKDNWSLCEFFADMGNRASEKEYLVAETVHACKINYAQHGECFSFKGKLQNGVRGYTTELKVQLAAVNERIAELQSLADERSEEINRLRFGAN